MSKELLNRETQFNVTARDGMKIFCRLNMAQDTPSTKAVILAHGLTGHLNEYIHLSARDYFNERGYDVYRISFYCSGKNYRDLQDTTLQIHANDLNDLIDHIKTKHKHKKIYICGHSYGGCALLFANPKADALSFWDSTFHPWTDAWKQREQSGITNIDDKYFRYGSGLNFTFGKNMLDEAKNTSIDEMSEKANALTAPANCISVENDPEPLHEELYKQLKDPKEFSIIEGADHCFTNADTVQSLLQKTHNWFERF